LAEIKQKWQDQIDKSAELQELKKSLKALKNLIREVEISGDMEEVERLKYDQLYQLQERIEEIEVSIREDNEYGNSLLKDKVNPEDIADVVSRWTGIPVRKVVSGERQKLLFLVFFLVIGKVGRI
jgi:ATP-dependent Clp protease ATP-binding subunit ClpA